MAISLLASLPVLLLFTVMQKRFIDGMVMSGLKRIVRGLPMHGTIFEPSRATKVIGDYDICGRRKCYRSLCSCAAQAWCPHIIENNGFFGGVATAGLVNVWHSIYDTTGERQIIGGLTEEVIERLVSCNAAIIDKTNLTRYCVFHPEVLKIILDQLVMENKIQPYLHTKFVAAYMEDNRVQAVIVEDKTGRSDSLPTSLMLPAMEMW